MASVDSPVILCKINNASPLFLLFFLYDYSQCTEGKNKIKNLTISSNNTIHDNNSLK